jgi:hypothetical protein
VRSDPIRLGRRNLRFSQDGKYLLEQFNSEITVFTVEPFAIWLKVQADKDVLAYLTPDSREIVFVSATSDAHPKQTVERWSIGDRVRVASSAIPPWIISPTPGKSPGGTVCGSTALAPGGRTLACDDMNGTLHVFDVASGKEVLKKRNFNMPQESVTHLAETPRDSDRMSETPAKAGSAGFNFSPDGRFVVAFPGDGGSTVIWDARLRTAVKPQGQIKRRNQQQWFFRAADQLLFVDLHSKERGEYKFETVTFPAGKVVSTQYTALGTVFLGVQGCATNPAFVVVSRGIPIPVQGIEKLNFSALEFGTGLAIPIQGDQHFADVVANHFVEMRDGELWLWERGAGSGGLAAKDRHKKASIVLREKLSDRLSPDKK